GRAVFIVSSQVESMNWPGPDADELGFLAFGSPPLSTPMMESIRPMWWFLLQSVVMFWAIASNIHWHWTPNRYVPAICGICLAWLITILMNVLKPRNLFIDRS